MYISDILVLNITMKAFNTIFLLSFLYHTKEGILNEIYNYLFDLFISYILRGK